MNINLSTIFGVGAKAVSIASKLPAFFSDLPIKALIIGGGAAIVLGFGAWAYHTIEMKGYAAGWNAREIKAIADTAAIKKADDAAIAAAAKDFQMDIDQLQIEKGSLDAQLQANDAAAAVAPGHASPALPVGSVRRLNAIARPKR